MTPESDTYHLFIIIVRNLTVSDATKLFYGWKKYLHVIFRIMYLRSCDKSYVCDTSKNINQSYCDICVTAFSNNICVMWYLLLTKDRSLKKHKKKKETKNNSCSNIMSYLCSNTYYQLQILTNNHLKNKRKGSDQK